MSEIRHGGNRRALAAAAGCAPEELLDFSVNLNPCGAPPGAFECYFRAFDRIGEYPEPEAGTAVAALAERFRRPEAEIVVGNGSNQLLTLLPEALAPRRAVIVIPGYQEYEASCRRARVPVAEFRLLPEREFRFDPGELETMLRPDDLVMLGNPGNPTGTLCAGPALKALAERRPDVLFLIDEAFLDFAGEGNSLAAERLPNVGVTRSFTKFHAMPGLRMGAFLGPEEWAGRLRKRLPAWSLSTPAAEMIAFLAEPPPEWVEHSRRETARLREKFRAELSKLPGVTVYPSNANFLLLKICRDDFIRRMLVEHRIALRDASQWPGLGPGFMRAAVRPEEEQERFLEAARRILAPASPRIHRRKRRTPAVMIQGTASNAGKSILAAGLCRALLQDGFAVAPFKAQNMALNSFVTPDGGEIGRAQAVQAEACRLDPDVRMNPILLKPSSDVGSQVIVLGKPVGNCSVREYFRRKPELWHQVTAAYDSLSVRYDAMVLEGAGSPGEINLKSGDLVNMRMAAYAEAPVILAGDIDRGGVYASFLGTWATFTPEERRLVAGFLVNKFRGDPSLLGDAHAYLERATGKPVLGVVDFLRDLALPEEDSVNFAFVRPAAKESRTLDLAIVGLGHIANFTDFAPFEAEPDVTVRKIFSADEFGEPDIVILPGSKSVAADLETLEQTGLAGRIRSAAARGATIAGICGGLQLLGEALLDPAHVESEYAERRCLGLLPVVTEMRPVKTVRRSRARRSNGTELSGYEIHHGESSCSDPAILRIVSDDGREIGFERGTIFSCYLHGVFDDDRFRRNWIDAVRLRKGWPARGGVTARYDTEAALDRLAAHLRSRIDLPELYRKMGL